MSLTEIPSPVKKKRVRGCNVVDESLRLEGRMRSDRKKLLVEVDSDSSSVSVECLNSTHEVSKKEKNHKKKQKVERKKSNTLLSMIDDSSSDSHHNDEGISIKDDPDDTVNTRNLPSLRLEGRKKSKKLLVEVNSDSSSISVRGLGSRHKVSKEEKNHKKKQKVERKKSNTLLSMIDDSSSDSHHNDEGISIKDDPDDTVNTRNLPSLRLEGRKKSKKLLVEVDSDSSSISVRGLSSRHEVSKEEKNHKKKQVKRKKPNTLLSMIDDSSSDSDHNDERIKIKDDPDDTANTKNLPKRIKSEIRSIYTTSEDEKENQFSDTQCSTNPSDHPLKVEAEDLEHLISVLNDEDQVPPNTLKKLYNLRVILQHKVPPQHMVESCAGSRGPTHEQKDIIEKFGPIKCGKYTPDEDNVIVKNWKSFCEVHDWDARDVKPFLYMRHQHSRYTTKFSERQKFVQYLANGLPWRTLYSVYWRFRNLYQPHLATRYTENEDRLIIAHMEKNSSTDTRNVRKFAELAKILNRTRASVWRRYRLLKKRRNPDQKPKFDMHLAKRIIKNLMQLTLSKDVHELKDLDIPLPVWIKLSEKFQIDHKELKQFWQTKLHMQLFCKKSVYLNDVKIKLIEYLYVSGIKERWEIDWAKITKFFDGMTSSFLSSIFNNLVRDVRLEDKELSEILEHLYEVKKPKLQQAATDKYLPKLVFKHGSLIVFGLDKKRKRNIDSSDIIDVEKQSTIVE